MKYCKVGSFFRSQRRHAGCCTDSSSAAKSIIA
jgi:hypothetical protein